MVDIAKLTTAAEKGDGCALKTELEHLPFEEGIAALKQIAAQSQQHSLNEDGTKNESLPQISFYTLGTGYYAYAELSLTKPGIKTKAGRSLLRSFRRRLDFMAASALARGSQAKPAVTWKRLTIMILN